MKKVKLLVVALFFVSFGVAAQGAFSFEKEQHDFGNIEEGTKATYVFKFKNTGDQPIVISNVRASCGCTTPDWSREPIAPGAQSSITVIYNSKNRPGNFYKTITITSNAVEASKSCFYQRCSSKSSKPRIGN